MRKIDPDQNDGYSLKQFDHYKCIFLHVPKAAGVSISRSLFGCMAGGHLTLKTYRLAFSPAEIERYFVFTFVRNPWDRLASAFFFLKGGGMHEKDRTWADTHLSEFEDFPSFVKKGLRRAEIRSWIHFRPQTEYLCPGKRDLSFINFLGFYENLHEDFSYVSSKLGIKRDLQSLNRSPSRRSYMSCYDDEMIQIVADVYREDIDLLGYSFDNSSLPKQLTGRPKPGR